MTSAVNDLIRQAADVTGYARYIVHTDTADDDPGGDITPDPDQGRRNGHVYPSASMRINDRIRRAAGIDVRPGHKPVPEIGGY
jgi:hypothetical protein